MEMCIHFVNQDDPCARRYLILAPFRLQRPEETIDQPEYGHHRQRALRSILDWKRGIAVSGRSDQNLKRGPAAFADRVERELLILGQPLDDVFDQSEYWAVKTLTGTPGTLLQKLQT